MIDRRRFLRSTSLGIAAATVGITAPVSGSATDMRTFTRGRFDLPQPGFASPSTVLSPGSPDSAGLAEQPLRALETQLEAWTRPLPSTGHPMYPGAVLLLVSDGTVVAKTAIGMALKYADPMGTELPVEQQIPMRVDTIFDLASLSKLFTTLVALQLIERGTVDLYSPVAHYLPGFTGTGKSQVNIEQLLTHTSGLDADPAPPLWKHPDIPARIKAVLEAPLVNPPGTVYLYSDLNMLNLQQVVQAVTGKPLDELVRERITGPLGMHDTGYNPPARLRYRIAPEEFELVPDRGLVWGQVHDENAWALGGVAGHAGIFSTAGDIALLGQTLLNGGSYRGTRILRERTVNQIFTNYNQRFPDDAHGLGFELNQIWYMGGLSSPRTAGHTGFTGTSVVVDAQSRSIAVLFTNRVHPTRSWGSNTLARETTGTALARAQPVRAPHGGRFWYAPLGNDATAVLSTPVPAGAPMDIAFDTFVDTESADALTVEATEDDVRWTPLACVVTGREAPSGPVTALSGHGHRAWWHVTARAPAGTTRLRWRYTTNSSYTGRGVNLAGILVCAVNGWALDSEAHQETLDSAGWQWCG